MESVILYPTETVYGLGVNALDPAALSRLYELKGRDAAKAASWLVRSVDEIEHYAEMDELARTLATHFLPGPLTLVLRAKDTVSEEVLSEEKTIGFRVSSDPHAAALAAERAHPLTCTSANVSGKSTLATPDAILKQFGKKAEMIDRVIDGGPRTGQSSTVVRVTGDDYEILREGAIPASALVHALT